LGFNYDCDSTYANFGFANFSATDSLAQGRYPTNEASHPVDIDARHGSPALLLTLTLAIVILALAIFGAIADWKYHKAGGKPSSRRAEPESHSGSLPFLPLAQSR